MTYRTTDLIGNDIKHNEVIPYLVEVELPGGSQQSDAFRKIRETLTRIGVVGSNKTLFQTCHVLHKRDRYYIVHFKAMYLIDGRENHLMRNDLARQNTIAKLLEQWGLVRLVNPDVIDVQCGLGELKILKHSDADQWTLKPKYQIGTI